MQTKNTYLFKVPQSEGIMSKLDKAISTSTAT